MRPCLERTLAKGEGLKALSLASAEGGDGMGKFSVTQRQPEPGQPLVGTASIWEGLPETIWAVPRLEDTFA